MKFHVCLNFLLSIFIMGSNVVFFVFSNSSNYRVLPSKCKCDFDSGCKVDLSGNITSRINHVIYIVVIKKDFVFISICLIFLNNNLISI